MPPSDAFEEAEGTEAAIMRATYDALCEHGYADLTVQRIGDEFPKSKSLIYQHYDGKDDLLQALLAFLLDRFEADMAREDCPDPSERLERILDATIAPGERHEFTRAMVELRAQAANDAAYRRHFTRSDRVFHADLETLLRDGIRTGVFRDVDPDATAGHLLAVINGAMLQRSTTDNEPLLRAARTGVETFVEQQLLTDSES